MSLKKIFENQDLVIYEDTKGFDFAYGIENKTDNKLIIEYGDDNEIIEVDKWLGLFADEEYIVDSIINEDYILREEI